MASPLRPLALALGVFGCSASPAGAPRPAPPVTRPAPALADTPPAPVTPARWAFFDRLGTLFDQGGHAARGPRPEPAIVDGVRVVVDAGIIVGSARHADRFRGFRSLPERLGGGFVLWSEDRVYRAKEFLGEPSAVADVGAPGGAWPWLSSVLLRTTAGLLELDPRAPQKPLHRSTLTGVAGALAVDARRAVRLDLLGRASFTTDGGASWTDVLATRGVRVRALQEGPEGEVVLDVERDRNLALGPSGDLAPVPTPPASARPHVSSLPWLRPSSSRALPGEILPHAVTAGALLPGDRILVAREGGARILAVQTGLQITDVDLAGVEVRGLHCQAAPVGSPAAVLACAGAGGAAVLDLEGSVARPALEATFPAGGGFIGGPRGRLAYDGRCGPEPASSTDLGPGTRPPEPTDESTPAPAAEPPGAPELPPDDDARVCVRAATAHWVERRLRGDDARRLYRWVPGDDAAVTALVLTGAAAPPDGGVPGGDRAQPSPPGEGVRVIRIDPADPAFAGGALPAVPPPQKEAPWRSVDTDFWQDDDGAIRGWLLLPPAGEEKVPAPPSAQGPAHRVLPVTPRRGGRVAGLRIDAAGHVTVHPLPPGTVQVVTGGRFALAMATTSPSPSTTGPQAAPNPAPPARTWFETVNGGATWTPIEGPPVGALDPPTDENAVFSCSPIGCAWATGVVRIGWGGAPPAPAPEPALAAASGPRPRAPERPAVTCRIDGNPPWVRSTSSPKPPPPKPPGKIAPPVALRLPAATVGTLHDHAWTAEVLPPFQPAAGPRRFSATDKALHGNQGSVVPILGAGARGAVDLLVLVEKRRLRAGGGAASFLPFDASGRFTVAADGPDGSLAIFDADRGALWLSRADATAGALHVLRAPGDAAQTRLTLARRLQGAGGGGLALVGYSTSTGDLVAGDLDLGRAEVGPLAALARLEPPADAGPCPKATHRLLLELPVRLRILGPKGEDFADEALTVSAVIDAGADRICVEAVEAVVRRPDPVVLRATLGPGGSASLWTPEATVRGTCSLEKPKP